MKRGGRVFIAIEKLPIEIIQKWIDLGHRHFCEKYVQETRVKWPQLHLKYPDIVLHLYGHLQTNKLKPALELYDGFESLDSLRLVQKLVSAQKTGESLPQLWAQVNLGAESQKSGLLLCDVGPLIQTCKKLQISLRGLMAIPPKEKSPLTLFQNAKRAGKQLSVE